MDYDKTAIADVYDEARAVAPEAARLLQRLLSRHIDPSSISWIVDVGCGTGRFSQFLADYFDAKVIGIEPSQKMLAQARRRPPTPNVVYRQGSAEAMPVDDGCADLMFMSMVYHHFVDAAAVARECRRVMQPGARLCIRNGAREIDFPHKRFFPGLPRLIGAALPTRKEIESLFLTNGFSLVTSEIVTQTVAENWSRFVEKTALRGDSLLAQLSQGEFEQGLQAMRSYRDRMNPDEPVEEEIAWLVFAR